MAGDAFWNSIKGGGVNDTMMIPARKAIGWYEENIPARGCILSLDDVKQLYLELSEINRDFGKKIISKLDREPNLTDKQWEDKKQFLLDDAFRLTVSVQGQRDQRLYGEDATVFSSEDLPMPVKIIYFTNVTAWQRHVPNSVPQNSIEVHLDFSKPALLDPNLQVSEPTPNNTSVTVKAEDMTFFRAVQQIVNDKLLSKRSFYNFIHWSFVYDFGMWFLVLPAALIIITYYMDLLLPAYGAFSTYRWAFFIYAIGMVLIFYRFLISYTKWAFPVTILRENRDTAWRHRATIIGIIGTIYYMFFNTIKYFL